MLSEQSKIVNEQTEPTSSVEAKIKPGPIDGRLLCTSLGCSLKSYIYLHLDNKLIFQFVISLAHIKYF